MTPLDDELRRALAGKAAIIPASGDPLAGIEDKARALRRRRLTLATGGSALAVVLILAIPLALESNRTGSSPAPIGAGQSSASPSAFPTSVASATASSPPAPASAGPAGWAFRGDHAVANRLAPAAAAAFVGLRTGAADPAAHGYRVQPLWAGTTPSGGYDALMFLTSQAGRVSHVVTYKASPGGSGIVADQPVGPATAYADAILPGDPANFVLVVGPPGSATTVTYTFIAGTQSEPVIDGVALFGRAAEARGDTSPDYLAVATATDPGVKSPINTHAVDPAIPGRLSTPDGAADWVYESLLAHDRLTAAEHVHARDAAAQRRINTEEFRTGPGSPAGCSSQGAGQFICNFRRPDGGLGTLSVSGGASAGFFVDDVPAHGTP